MKKILLALLATASIYGYSQQLKHIEISNKAEALNYISNPEYEVYYQSDNFVIANTDKSGETHTTIDNTPWEKDENYFVVWTDDQAPDSYRNNLSNNADIIYKGINYYVLDVPQARFKNITPAVHGGVVKLNNNPIKTANTKAIKDVIFNPTIEGYVSETEIDSVVADIIHMENYGTRNCYEPQSFDAQDWIKAELESYNLDVSLQDFSMSGGDASDNVIAVQTGLVNPDTYVVVGGHYDSYCFGSQTNAPGADDNASGTAGVMEVARILSQYEFSYTIVYCAFSGEEYGLYGSAAYASDAASNGMNILGYLNLDMIGYLHPGDDFHTDLICPSSAQPLADYYEEIVNTYVTDFAVFPGNLVGGDSDHTSFNNNGYMGIFPFEDGDNHSPYIHSTDDTYGLSVNSDPLAEKFVKAAVAFVADFAEPFNGLYPPMSLTAVQGEDQVELNWDEPLISTDFIQYKIYRNDVAIDSVSELTNTTYTDNAIETGNEYTYYITAQYGGSNPGESYPSNSVVIEFGLMEIISFDFETGVQEWTIDGSSSGWQLAPVNLSGNSTDYISIDSDAAGSGTHVFDYAISPELDLQSYHTLKLDFDYGYRDYGSDFFKVLYRPDAASDWTELETLSASSSFTNKIIELPEDIQTSTAQIAMYYDDNDTWAWYAGFDNVKITGYEGTPPPPAPQNLTYEVIDETVELNWSAPAKKEMLKYYTYKDGNKTDSVDATVETYTDDEVTAGNTYTYYITALYTDGESGPSNQVNVTLTGVQENAAEYITVYPNPAKNYLNINLPENLNSGEIEIYDICGKLMKQMNMSTASELSIDISDLHNGIYFLRVIGNDVRKDIKFSVVK